MQKATPIRRKRKSGAGATWVPIIGLPLYGVLLIVFGTQTFLFVNILFPADNWFMKLITVFSFDVCSVLYAIVEIMYPWRRKKSKHIVFGMWMFTFALSFVASMMYMYLNSTHLIPHMLDASLLAFSYGLVLLAFGGNIIAITVVIRLEIVAGQEGIDEFEEEEAPTHNGLIPPYQPMRYEIEGKDFVTLPGGARVTIEAYRNWLAFLQQPQTHVRPEAVTGEAQAVPLAQQAPVTFNHDAVKKNQNGNGKA